MARMSLFGGVDRQALDGVLAFLTTKELLRVRCACRVLNAASRSDVVWAAAASRDFDIAGASGATALSSAAPSPDAAMTAPVSEYEAAWRKAMSEFGRYFDRYTVVSKLWRRIERWAVTHFPTLNASLVCTIYTAVPM